MTTRGPLRPHAAIALLVTLAAGCGGEEVEEVGFAQSVAELACGKAFECRQCQGGVTLLIVEPYAGDGFFGGATSPAACEFSVGDHLLSRLQWATDGNPAAYDGFAAAACVSQIPSLIGADAGCRCHVDLDMRGVDACRGVVVGVVEDGPP